MGLGKEGHVLLTPPANAGDREGTVAVINIPDFGTTSCAGPTPLPEGACGPPYDGNADAQYHNGTG